MTIHAWHAITKEQIFSALKTSERGLRSRDAAERLAKGGPNELARHMRAGGPTILFRQFRSALTLLLIAAGAVSFFLGEYTDATVILFTVAVTVSFGFFQEWKSERALAALHSRIELSSRVVRNGAERIIPAREMVPGDVVHLAEGDRVPADIRILTSKELEADESTLTGEALPAEKAPHPVAEGTALADRSSMLYLGTTVVRGSTTGVVVATGKETELGLIAVSLANIKEPPTPLQQATTRLVFGITALVAVGIIITLGVGVARGIPFFSVLVLSVAVAVAAIPEGLTVSVTAMLTRGMLVLLKSKALVRRLLAAETLGAVSVVCLDKTGTITRGEMHCMEVSGIPDVDVKRRAMELLAESITGARPTRLGDAPSRWEIVGEGTERALLIAAVAAGEGERYRTRLIADSLPFSSERGFHATISVEREGAGARLIAVGAPEKIMAASSRVVAGGGPVLFDHARQSELASELLRLTGSGYRTLAVAWKDLPASRTFTPDERDRLPHDMIFTAFAALADPIRPEVRSVVSRLREAGIRPVIITGDNPVTATAVAKAIGIPRPEASAFQDGEKLSPAEFEEMLQEVNVFARITPVDKLRIIQGFQASGQVVAMTGDGVNDAPALKRADIGVVMGSGTDVAKEVADLVLLDNKLPTLVRAVFEGRGIFENIRKVVVFLFYDSFTEVVLISSAILLNLPLPLLAAQILWVNLIEDVGPSFAMAFEPAESRLLREPPRRAREPLLPGRILGFTIATGIATSALLLGLFFLLLGQHVGIEYVRTMIFVGLGIDSLFTVFAIRRLRESILETPFFGNKPMLAAVATGFVLYLVGIYAPPISRLLGTVPIELRDWMMLVAFGIINLIIVEALKALFLRRPYAKTKTS